ncbi:ABC transporter permease [Cryptosporangium minutisporangium]|uniref:ABC transporter permease n=2 Tax=Cryptosporangium minutisporangium TaxID=113569 RepID=A0ABP6STD2_9ACTN
MATLAPDRPTVAARLRRAGGRAVTGAALPALLASLVVGAIVLLTAGTNPITGYEALVRGVLLDTNLPYLAAAFAPILGMAVSFAIPLRMGEFNLGGDGQLVLGGITAAAVAMAIPSWGLAGFGVAAVAGAAAAALWAALAVPLARYGRVPVIISTLLLGFPAVSFASYLARYPLTDKGTGIPQTPRLPDAMHLPALPVSAYVNLGLVVAVLVLAAYWVVDARTGTGLQLRTLGANLRFGQYVGIDVGRRATGALAASGAVAGLTGALIVAGPPYRFIDGALVTPGYTFTGVTVALIASGRPAGLLAGSVLFTALQVGGTGMERDVGIPRQLTAIIQASVVITFVLIVAVRAYRSRTRAGAR